MKEQAIKKINKIGKISNIIVLICKILVGIALVGTLLGAITCFVIPDSLIDVTMTSMMTVDVDYSSLGVTLSEEEMVELQAEMAAQTELSMEEGVTDITLVDNVIRVAGEIDKSNFTMRDIAWLVVLGLVTVLMTFITLFFVGGLCKAFANCQSPFEDNVIKKMQRFAISLIPWSIISAVSNSVIESVMSNKLNIMFNVDLGVILIVLVVLVLTYIFKYGAVLQQESDETL